MHFNAYFIAILTRRYLQHCMQHKAMVFKLLMWWIWGFLLCRGDTLHWKGWNL